MPKYHEHVHAYHTLSKHHLRNIYSRYLGTSTTYVNTPGRPALCGLCRMKLAQKPRCAGEGEVRRAAHFCDTFDYEEQTIIRVCHANFVCLR